MNRIEPLSIEDVPAEVRPIVEGSEQLMGFTANDVLVMAKWPELLQSLAGVVNTIYGPSEIDDELKRLVGLVASTAAGCRYCQAHTAHGAGEAGAAEDKIAAVWEFETSPLFTGAERAALRIARGGGSQPNGVTDEEFKDLRDHFTERQALEIVAMVSLFGFLNRWNDTLKTQIEDVPAAFAARVLQQGH